LVWDEIRDNDNILPLLKNNLNKLKPDEILLENDEMFVSIYNSSRQLVGLINIKGIKDTDITDEIKNILIKTSKIFEVALERECIRLGLEEEKNKYYRLSSFDHLTGCHSRYYLSEMTKRLFALHDRKKIDTLAFILLDIDDFKYVNDTFGHDIGDIVLKEFGNILRKYSREGDIVVRFGGEEFLIVVINETEETIMALTKRIKDAIENKKWDPPLENIKITASFGVAFRRLKESFDSLLSRADKMLYKSKNSGKNCINIDTI